MWAGQVNREAFMFNRALFGEAMMAIKYLVTQKLDRVSDVLRSFTQKLAERQRMILLADNSDYGWVTVRKYQGDDWAINSRDQSKIAQAEAKAQRELVIVSTPHPHNNQPSSPDIRSRDRSPYRKPTYSRAISAGYRDRSPWKQSSAPLPNMKDQTPPIVQNVQGDTVQPLMDKNGGASQSDNKGEAPFAGKCYKCGEAGHIQYYCPHFRQ
jgi:hypothetical protein